MKRIILSLAVGLMLAMGGTGQGWAQSAHGCPKECSPTFDACMSPPSKQVTKIEKIIIEEDKCQSKDYEYLRELYLAKSKLNSAITSCNIQLAECCAMMEGETVTQTSIALPIRRELCELRREHCEPCADNPQAGCNWICREAQ